MPRAPKTGDGAPTDTAPPTVSEPPAPGVSIEARIPAEKLVQ